LSKWIDDLVLAALATEGVRAYEVGLCYMAVCASADLTPEEVEERVERLYEAGTTRGWVIHDGPFTTEEENGVRCNMETKGRRHWLLAC